MILEKPIKIECPNCKKCELPIWHPKSICENCGKEYKWHELQRKWQKVFISSQNGSKKNSSGKFERCVRCADPSMIYYKKLNIWVCFSCGNGWKPQEISRCLGCWMFTDEVIESVCPACWEDGLGVSIDTPVPRELNQIYNHIE